MQCMADVDRNEVLRIAELANLSLSEAELAAMTDELGAIVDYVRQLQEVDIAGVPPTTHLLVDALPLRPDVVAPSLDRGLTLSQAPASRDGSFAVAAFVDEG